MPPAGFQALAGPGLTAHVFEYRETPRVAGVFDRAKARTQHLFNKDHLPGSEPRAPAPSPLGQAEFEAEPAEDKLVPAPTQTESAGEANAGAIPGVPVGFQLSFHFLKNGKVDFLA